MARKDAVFGVVIFLCFAPFTYIEVNKAVHLMADGLHAEGIVVELRGGRKRLSKTHAGVEFVTYPSLSPVVRYVDADGKDQLYLSDLGSTNPKYDVGDSVPIIYLRDHKDVRIDSFEEVWLPAIILGIFAFSPLVILILPFSKVVSIRETQSFRRKPPSLGDQNAQDPDGY